MIKDRSAGIVIRDGSILMMHRIKNGEEYYSFPGGGIEPGEAPHETVVREIMEEMSVTVSVKRLMYTIKSTTGKTHHLYECDYVSGVPALRTDSPEHEKMKTGTELYDPQWLPLSQVACVAIHPREVRDRFVADKKLTCSAG